MRHAVLLFALIFLAVSPSMAEACRSVQLIQGDLLQKALAAVGRDSATLYSKQMLKFHYVQEKSAPRTSCPQLYEGEFELVFQDGCRTQVAVNTNPNDPGEVTVACARHDSVMPQAETTPGIAPSDVPPPDVQPSDIPPSDMGDDLGEASPEMRTICVALDAEGHVADAQCPGFTGAEFFCPDGLQMTEVPAQVFPQACGPYR